MKLARATLALLLTLVLTGSAAAKEISVKEHATKNQRREFQGAYMNGKKVGWSVRESKLGKYQGRDVLVETEDTQLTFLVGGNPYHMRVTEKSILSLEGAGQIEHFEESKILNDNPPVIKRATRKGKSLVITTTTGGHTLTRTIPLAGHSIQQDMRFVAWLNGARRAGDTFAMQKLSLDEKDGLSKSTLTFVKTGQIPVNGVSTRVVFLSRTSPMGVSDEVLTAGGVSVQVTLGTMMQKLETESVAKSKIVAADMGLDIKVKKNVGPPVLIDRMTLEVKGLSRSDIPTTHYQRILSEKNGVLTVELIRDFSDESVLHPLTARQRAELVEATPEIQSDHKTIRELARKIIGKETNPLKQAGMLQEWVFRNLKKTYAISASTSLGVLKNRAGKCTDHALLFVSLARSVNLPAREVTGVMYIPDPAGPNFGPHAWAEFHDGKRWITVDPTINEVYVNGAHFRFSDDSGKPPVSALFSKTAITIVRVETRTELLSAFGSASVSHAVVSKQHLKLLFRAVDKKILTGDELNRELKGTLALIEMNISQLTALAKSNLTYADSQSVNRLIETYRSLKLQAAALKAFAEKRGETERKSFQTAGETAKKLIMNIGT